MNVIRQRKWTEAELTAAGFRYFERRKQRLLAGRLPASHAPLVVQYSEGVGYAEAGDVLCFEPGDSVRAHILDYTYWSVKAEIFASTYRRWDGAEMPMSAPEQHLYRHGCRPYYKFRGAWAKKVTQPTWMQSLESPEPQLLQPGVWLLVGDTGEPWHAPDDAFRRRYVMPAAAVR